MVDNQVRANKCPPPQDEPLRTEYSPYAAYGYPDLVNPYAHHAMSRSVLDGLIGIFWEFQKLDNSVY